MHRESESRGERGLMMRMRGSRCLEDDDDEAGEQEDRDVRQRQLSQHWSERHAHFAIQKRRSRVAGIRMREGDQWERDEESISAFTEITNEMRRKGKGMTAVRERGEGDQRQERMR